MDMLLSLPVQRARVIIEKFLAYGVSIIGVVVLIYLGLQIGVIVGGVEMDVARLAEVTFYLIPLMCIHHVGYHAYCRNCAAAVGGAGHHHRLCRRQLYAADDRTGSGRHSCRANWRRILLHLLQRWRYLEPRLHLAAYCRLCRADRCIAFGIAVSL